MARVTRHSLNLKPCSLPEPRIAGLPYCTPLPLSAAANPLCSAAASLLLHSLYSFLITVGQDIPKHCLSCIHSFDRLPRINYYTHYTLPHLHICPRSSHPSSVSCLFNHSSPTASPITYAEQLAGYDTCTSCPSENRMIRNHTMKQQEHAKPKFPKFINR